MSGSSQSWKQTFVYDRYGNRTFDAANTSSGMVSSLLTIDQSTNRFTTGQGSILYDNVGNLTRDFNAHTFSYDGENHQVAYDGGATSNGTDYKYDGDGRRVKKVTGTNQQTTIFIYDAQGVMVAEYSTLSQQGSGGTSYLTMDSLGTPRVVTGADGGVKARHDYLPFGEEIGLSGGRTASQGYVVDSVRQKFTQKERDVETGLDYSINRYYSSTTGRFTTTDPTLLSVNAFNPQSWNRYTYVLNNPLLYVDPLGLWALRLTTIYKTDGDGNDVLDKHGQKIVDHVEVTAIRTSDDDTAASLAEQLGLTGKEAQKFADKVGNGNDIRLSEQGGRVGEVYKAVEGGLKMEFDWQRENYNKLDQLAAKGIYGPGHSDCSRTACQIGLGQFLGLHVGTNVLDPLLDTDARAVSASDARVGDIIRYAKSDNVATHFANFIFRNDDGTPVAFSKSGETGPYEVRNAASLQVPTYGTIRGRNSGDSGFYRRR
jgi:RHS repeat-associated protein